MKAKLLPCQEGNRCKREGEGCTLHDLHPSDWHLDPDDPRRIEPATDAERLRYIDAQWACEDCPFRQGCEARGMDEIHGIWGGRTPDQRRQLREELAERHQKHEALVARMIRNHQLP